jgi:hypothetical protein
LGLIYVSKFYLLHSHPLVLCVVYIVSPYVALVIFEIASSSPGGW